MKLELFFIEISCVGFTSNNLKPFSNLIKTWGINVNQLVSKCTEVACRATYYIFNRRGKSWDVIDILKFEQKFMIIGWKLSFATVLGCYMDDFSLSPVV